MSETDKDTASRLASHLMASRQTVLPKRLVAPGPDAAELAQLRPQRPRPTMTSSTPGGS